MVFQVTTQEGHSVSEVSKSKSFEPTPLDACAICEEKNPVNSATSSLTSC